MPIPRRAVLRATTTAALAAVVPGRAGAASPEPEGSPALDTLLTLDDFEAAARERMPRPAYEYVAGGAADEITVGWNRTAFAALRLRPRVLAEVERVDMSVRLFGDTFAHPLLLAPTGYHLMVHPEGEVGVARGASAAGAGLVLSTTATTPVEDVAKAAATPWWFQLYVQPDRGFTRDLLDRVAALGGRAVCLTVDTPVLGARNREQRSGFKLPPGLTTPMNPVANAARREALSSRKREPWRRVAVTWRDVEWLLANTKLPVLLKGVLHPADAERAVGLGVAGIMVSNHGGRNLDTALATIDALPAIVEGVGQKVPVLVDGGIRRGTDALKALARGARAVLVGRPYLYGLAVGGAAGVTRVMEILRTELEMAMMLAGAPSLAAIDPSIVEAPPCGK